MSDVRNTHSVWVGAVCCLTMVGCSERAQTPVTANSGPAAPALEQQTGNSAPAGSAAQAIVQSGTEPGWEIVEKTDEMAGTVTRLALYQAKIGATTVEVEMTCPEQGADGGPLQVTTFDGLLATAFDEGLGNPSATARVDTGNGEIRSVALMQSEKYNNVYFYVNRGGVQLQKAMAREMPILRGEPIEAHRLSLNGDPANFKLELELDNGTKRVIRGDATLAQYLGPCTAEAAVQRQQQKVEEQRQLQETEAQQQKEKLDQWSREQQEAATEPEPTEESGEGEIAPQQ